VRFHNWYNAPKVWKKVLEIDPVASHASWMENFPWTRVADVRYPDEAKPMIDIERFRLQDPSKARELLGDGNFGGRYQRSDDEMLALWRIAVDEVREVIEGPWA
jgi:creatinine amidohydrolase